VSNQVIQTNTGTYVDRPDIAKNVKPALTLKEVNDCVIKFLMLAEIPFSGKETLPLITEFVYRKGTRYSESMSISQNSYTVTCKLTGIKVDGKPVYIVVIPETLTELNNRHRNKLIKLVEQYKIVILDYGDWHSAGLDISDKKWLKPLNRRALKSLARKIFNKIAKLGDVTSDITLNQVFESINNNTGRKSLEKENFNLKCKVRELFIREKFNVEDTHSKVIQAMTRLNSDSLSFIAKTCDDAVGDLGDVDLKKKRFKDLFRLKNGKVTFLDKELIASYVYSTIDCKKNKNIDIENLGYGVLRIRNKRTFQVVTLAFTCSSSKGARPLALPKGVVDKIRGSLLFNIHVIVPRSGSKVSEVVSYVILADGRKGVKGSYSFTGKDKLPVYHSFRKGGLSRYTLWSFINDGI
jgi:hypothetical protein